MGYNKIMSKFIVVSIHRDRFIWPKLSIVVEAHVSSESAGMKFITQKVMASYEKRQRGKWGRWSTMTVCNYRVVDAEGFKRLRAAAKASATIRRRRAAKKAAVTRAKNRAAAARITDFGHIGDPVIVFRRY